MELPTFKKTDWKDGKGHKLMEARVVFPRKVVTISEPMDGRSVEEIEKALTKRLESLFGEYQ